MITDFDKAIRATFPGCAFHLIGNDYAGLTWLDQNTPKPTLEELEAAWSALITPEQRRANMAAAFDALPVSVQAAFYVTRVAAEHAMDRGRFDIARALIEAQVVPAELETTKAAILSHFPTE